MNIEEEIRQETFRNEYQKSAINLIFTYGWLNNKQKNFFKKFNITSQQYNVLRILKGQFPDAISTSDIKSRMLDKNSDVSRIVDRLSNKELIYKNTCISDKRLVDVSITHQGLQLLSEIEIQILELDNLFSHLELEEAKELNRLLDKLRG
jgi:DNA-binding MarR family transcriptional regulator